MNSLPASEIKRRGISVVDELLEKGPVHVIQNNRPRYVIQSEESYQAEQARQSTRPNSRPPNNSVWDLIQNRPWQGTKTKAEIDAEITEERASWDESD